MPRRVPGRLRSDAWLRGDDEVALANRVALASAGLEVDAEGGRPVIGIANSASDLNPCNLPLRDLAGAVRAGIQEAGGVPAEFGSVPLGEDLMKPSAMLYRNLLSIEIEEIIRSYPLDGIVLLAGCDKTVPGAIMGAVSADLPMVLVTSGSRKPAAFRGRRIGTGSDLWRLWDERRAGRLDDAGWRELERCLACGTGTCNTMGTASTMAILAETLGLMIPGSGTIPAGSPRGRRRGRGRRPLRSRGRPGGPRPSTILTPAAFANAIRMLHAVGGSTNAIIHLAAIAGRAGRPAPPRRPRPRSARASRCWPTWNRPAPVSCLTWTGPAGSRRCCGNWAGGWTPARSPSPAPRSARSPAPLPRRPARSARPGFRWGTKGLLPWSAAPWRRTVR